jgi:hypothetical protein
VNVSAGRRNNAKMTLMADKARKRGEPGFIGRSPIWGSQMFGSNTRGRCIWHF